MSRQERSQTTAPRNGGLFAVSKMATLSFSDTTNKLGIIQTCESICNLGDAGISGDSLLLKEFTRYSSRAQSQIWTWIFFAYGGWQFEDSNQTDLPSATDTLTSGKASYALPVGAHAIRGIEVKDTGGVWHPLAPLTEEEIRQRQAVSEFFKTSSMPMYYQPVGDSARVFPPANYTQASSWKVYFDREMVAFASTDTTKNPGIPSAFQEAIPDGASLEWLKVHKPGSDILKSKMGDWQDWEKRITKYYAQRYAELFPPKFTVSDYSRENM